MGKSVYETIVENMTRDGKLPEGFSLDAPAKAGEVRFAPGAMEGTMAYHWGIKFDKKGAEKLAKKILLLCGEKEISENKKKAIEKKIENAVNNSHCLSVVDNMQEELYKNGEKINGDKLFDYGCRLAFEGTDIECVKLGIALLGMFNAADEWLCERLSCLGVYEELTLFVAVAFSNYKNGNSLLFDLAKRVNGWGRIHILERLEPENDEIKEWIFKCGYKNNIMEEYSALGCAKKGDYIGILRKDCLDREELDASCELFCALIDEGPVKGMSVYEHAEEAVKLLVGHLKRQAESILHFGTVTDIKRWIEESDLDKKDDLIDVCDSILQEDCVKVEIERCITDGNVWDVNRAVNLGYKLNMDNSGLIYEAIKRNPTELHWQINNIKNNREYVEELIKLYEKLLPLEKMTTGASLNIFPKEYIREFHAMDSVLNALDKYPALGEKFLVSALSSPGTRGRHSACRVIEAWIEEGCVSDDIIRSLKAAVKNEVDKELKDRMNKIIKKVQE
ncbi:MAG: hypothetical protein IJO83_05280 [Clostridia bacterium]|nr:hypothetical protein [Clostridia bacterium]